MADDDDRSGDLTTMPGRTPNTSGKPSAGVSQSYTGTPLWIEGGVRAGGDWETMPAQYTFIQPKNDFEHRFITPTRGDTVHGMGPSVEGIPGSDGMLDRGEYQLQGVEQLSGMSGPSNEMNCMAGGCKFQAKTPHGLSRHMFSKHGGHGMMKNVLKRK